MRPASAVALPPLDAAHRTEDPVVTDAAPRFPPQIRFIIGNEAVERFSFYGMRNILTVFLLDYLCSSGTPGTAATRPRRCSTLFVMGVYLFPLLGGVSRTGAWGSTGPSSG